jgi:hypothetical protein
MLVLHETFVEGHLMGINEIALATSLEEVRDLG